MKTYYIHWISLADNSVGGVEKTKASSKKKAQKLVERKFNARVIHIVSM